MPRPFSSRALIPRSAESAAAPRGTEGAAALTRAASTGIDGRGPGIRPAQLERRLPRGEATEGAVQDLEPLGSRRRSARSQGRPC